MPTTGGDDWPELGDELAYKALEALQERVWQWGEGQITRAEVIRTCTTLMDTISGIVPWGVYHFIRKIRGKLEREEAHP